MKIQIVIAAILGALLAPGAENPQPQFDVASVRVDNKEIGGAGYDFPRNGTWKWTRISLGLLATYAYKVSPDQITNVPPRFHGMENAFTIVAKTRPDVRDEEFRSMLQSLLKERFQFAMHWDTKELPAVTIAVAKGGSLLKPASGECLPIDKSATPPPGQVRCGDFRQKYETRDGTAYRHYSGRSVSVSDIVDGLSFFFGPTIDDTGIQGKWDIDVDIDVTQPANTDEFDQQTAYWRKMRAAFEKQAGLTIDFAKSKKRPVPVVVVDHVELPLPN